MWARINNWPARCWLIVALVFMALLYGYAIWNNQSTVLQDGRRAFWLHDDMMISMRYARNLAGGFGLVWNPGQAPVEGYSNFGWLLVMAAIHLLPLPETLTSLVMLAINVFLAGIVLILTTRLAHRLVPNPGIWLLGALVTLVIIVDLARWTTIGLEVPLLTAVFLWLLIRVLDEAEMERPRPITFLLAGILGLIRVDGPLLAGILCLVAIGLQKDKMRILAYSTLILVFPLVHVLFRLTYYGYPLPNTYYLKLVAWDARLLPGLSYLSQFGRLYGFLLIFATLSAIQARNKRVWLLLAAGLPLVAYGLLTGGDDFGGARFFAPWLPVLTLIAFLNPDLNNWPPDPLPRVAYVLTITFLIALTAGYRFYQGPGEESTLANAGLILEEVTRPDTSIGVFWAGTLPYFAHRTAVDMLGKSDPYIARLPANEGSLKPGHNKFNYDYSLAGLQPDLLVSPLSITVLSDPELFQTFTKGDDAYGGQLFLDETFQQNYAPSLLMIDSLPLLIWSDSQQRDRLLAGRECEAVTFEELQKFGFETVCWLNGR